jgi:hydrogenase nickel incorporation protein HypA/HybF
LHEFSAALSIVDAAVEATKGHDIKKVTAVNVEIGEFTFLVPEQLEFNFEIASQKTIIEGAKLKITKVKGKVKCHKCGFEGEAQAPEDLPGQMAFFAPMQCAECHSSATEITGGKDFTITNIEAEVTTAS